MPNKTELLDILFQIPGMPEHKRLKNLSVAKLTKMVEDSGVEFVWHITEHHKYQEGSYTVSMWPSRFENHARAQMASFEASKMIDTMYFMLYPQVLSAPEK